MLDIQDGLTILVDKPYTWTSFDVVNKMDGYAIKVPVFSFDKFPNVDKNLGPEMKSTGEYIRFIKDLKDPFFRELDRNRSMYLTR